MSKRSPLAGSIRQLSRHVRRLLEGEKVLRDFAELETRVKSLEARLEDLQGLVQDHMLRSQNQSLAEALNSGDGSYKP
jgi:hypothetical protein